MSPEINCIITPPQIAEPGHETHLLYYNGILSNSNWRKHSRWFAWHISSFVLSLALMIWLALLSLALMVSLALLSLALISLALKHKWNH